MAELTHIEIASIYGVKTQQGLVELTVNDQKVQLDLPKAREILQMLHAAIEAAVSDELFVLFLTQKMGLSIEHAGAALLDFRELRQGSRKRVQPH